jgi:DNA-binding transcriptional LysR family regulator
MKIKPSVLIDMKSTEFIKEWVSQGKGISILIKRAVTADDLERFSLLPLQEKPSLDVSVLFLKSRKYDLAIRRFLHHVEELKSQYTL